MPHSRPAPWSSDHPRPPEAMAVPPQLVLGPVLAELAGSERVRLVPILARGLSRWSALLQSARIEGADGRVLALWLPAEVEAEVDQAQTGQPALGLLLHRLASRLLMAAAAQARPELAAHGCAPLPGMAPGAVRALAALGLDAVNGLPARRYAVLIPDSHAALAAGCAACSLRGGCPGPNLGDSP